MRALYRRISGGWELACIWTLIGAEPPGWSQETWEYDQLIFVSEVIQARELAVLASPEPGAMITVGPAAGTIPEVLGPAHWTRRPGYASHDRLPLPRPVTEYTLTPRNHDRQLPQSILAGRACPSFPGPNTAWRAFFEGDFSLAAAQPPPHYLAVLRSIDQACWLGQVRVGPTELTAEICGNQVRDCEVELFGMTGRSCQAVDGPGTVTFTLERGLPASAWLWLKQDRRWLDYRVIDPHSGWADESSAAGVEFDLPSEPQANLEALLAAGEGPVVEFKRQLPESAEQKRKVLKTVAAFATGDGGTVVFGMDPDELTVTGLGAEDPRRLRDRLHDLVNRIVIPPPPVAVAHYMVDGKAILLLAVEPGPLPPYGIAVDKGSRDKPEYYVRRGASTYPAQPGDLREAARSRPAAEATGQMTPFGPW